MRKPIAGRHEQARLEHVVVGEDLHLQVLRVSGLAHTGLQGSDAPVDRRNDRVSFPAVGLGKLLLNSREIVAVGLELLLHREGQALERVPRHGEFTS